ncbi:hypothetical protein MESS2_660016 [Mesorhizobium metallidurans STM 2683]|uniref:Uncharacterized protein n=1 Tax=Mesorhizobium metallidurans STM 2683 TaxID=1297569 RepID=M5EUR5_9HYPH|nr:hypothetical protein MESS2_660016 [Mesorhizobium metallidurans STM 2683]
MYTRDSGGKTRQIGDTIENKVPAIGSVGYRFKLAAGAAGVDWCSLTLSRLGAADPKFVRRAAASRRCEPRSRHTLASKDLQMKARPFR